MTIAPLLGSLALLGAASAPADDAGARGASEGLAILAAKALTVPMEGPASEGYRLRWRSRSRSSYARCRHACVQYLASLLVGSNVRPQL